VHRLLLPAFLLFNFLPILVPVFTMNTNNHKVHITSFLFYLCNTNFPAKTINNPILKFIQWIQEFINVLYKLRTKNQKKKGGKKIGEKTESSSKDVETLEIHSSPTLHYKSSVTKKLSINHHKHNKSSITTIHYFLTTLKLKKIIEEQNKNHLSFITISKSKNKSI
jgi:hypothetical protein